MNQVFGATSRMGAARFACRMADAVVTEGSLRSWEKAGLLDPSQEYGTRALVRAASIAYLRARGLGFGTIPVALANFDAALEDAERETRGTGRVLCTDLGALPLSVAESQGILRRDEGFVFVVPVGRFTTAASRALAR